MISQKYQNMGLGRAIFRAFIEIIATEIRKLGLEGDENFRRYPPDKTIPSEQRVLRKVFITAHRDNSPSIKAIQHTLGEKHNSTSQDPRRIAFRVPIKTTQGKKSKL